MTKASNRYESEASKKDLCYNICRYQHLTQTSNEQLADALELTPEQLQNRMLDVESWSRSEIEACARFFKCPLDTLLSDSHRA